MTKNVLEVIRKKMNDLQNYIALLKSVSSEITEKNIGQDPLKYWGLERGLHISIECIIDIANIIISSADLGKPETYRESIQKLGEFGIIPPEFAKKLARMVAFRNILVHDYSKIDDNVIVSILRNDLDDFIEFIKYVNVWLEGNL
ncbi:type VII toxin-antitoxin system HepT family RNase toxin [Zhaonella formicivorans]|jgi:uncharacterized protein YutE (UPF0331/DUF86 family)|uniref:type VII toxin-antitoxin system HepT family RNase toxin n=1 Tax=Zhaonella formicivorans TaxID=2528593 RepID=UPI0010E7DE38|nr:DUF86 domain-containing protein [Zhaonella formicivorans]